MRGVAGFDPAPYQWAAAGYDGAIRSGKTICGTLFGGSAFLGYLHGKNASEAPGVQDGARKAAIDSVNGLFRGFLERFNDTDCQRLTGCDWSNKEDRERYLKDEVYKDTCFRFFEYVLENCLERTRSLESGPQ